MTQLEDSLCLATLPIMASTAALGNWVLSFMSAWMVGKVEAPAKANMIVLKAET